VRFTASVLDIPAYLVQVIATGIYVSITLSATAGGVLPFSLGGQPPGDSGFFIQFLYKFFVKA
jgi:hypothetical protein